MASKFTAGGVQSENNIYMKLYIGLGNPGEKYRNTRHNIGFMMLDYIFDKLTEAKFSNWSKNKKFQAEISEGNLHGEKIILAKPYTFMNESGISAQALMHFYKIAPLDLTVLHDDLDIEFGLFKLQTDRSSAGHNGIKSIIEKINTQQFNRVRLGIAKKGKNKQADAAKYVLKKFNFLEKIKLNSIFEQVYKSMF